MRITSRCRKIQGEDMSTAPSEKAAQRSRNLKVWKAAYYAGNPLVPDEVYDYHENLQKQEWPEDPELQVVGGIAESSFEQVEDGVAMLSLKKTYSPDELIAFISGRPIVVELKCDGGSIELRYREGYLVQGVTRGRGGELGSDVTENARRLADVPQFIEGFTGEIRGEAVQTFKDFEEYNKKMKAEGKELLKHPRNTANGTLQSHDPTVVNERKLRFIAYQVVGQEDRWEDEVDLIMWLKEQGFKLPRTKQYKQAILFTKEIQAQLSMWKAELEKAEFPCDGLVIILKDRKLRLQLGVTSTHPNGAIAFKWENEKAEAPIVDIEWSTGRLGDVDPVGIIEPTHLSGAEITRVTLHHVGYVRQHNVKIGSKIKIIRSGEIIPKHLETLETPENVDFNIPKECPSCGTTLVEEEGVTPGAFSLVCTNILCPAQQFERILHFVKIAGIDHLGEGILKALFRQGYVKNIPDLYLLPAKGIETLTMKGKTLGSRRAKKININIEKASVLPIWQFVAALGIRGLGRGTCKKLFEKFDTIEELLTAGPQDFLKVEGFARTKAHIAHTGIQANVDLIKQMLPLVKFKQEDTLTLPRVLSGMRFVVTGSFSEENPRKEIEKLIKESGGQIQPKPNKFTNYLMKGEGGGKKATIAAKFGTPVLNEEGFFDLITQRSETLEKEDVDEE